MVAGVGRLLDRGPVPLRRRPAHGIGDHLTHDDVVVRRIRLVPGSEIEDLAIAAAPGAAAAEDLAALEPGNENLLLGRGNDKGLAVHFLGRQFEMRAQTRGNRVPGIADPEPLPVIGLAPRQRTRRAHQPPKHLRIVRGMKHDQAHAFQHAPLDAFHDRLGDLVVGQVTPPRQHIRLGQALLGQAMLGLLQRRGGHDRTRDSFPNALCDGRVHPLRIDRADFRIFVFVHVLAPNHDA